MGLHQTKRSFCSVKEITDRVRRQLKEGENIFSNHIPDMELIFKIYKELKQLNRKKRVQLKNDQRN